jgi:hypothetical protein
VIEKGKVNYSIVFEKRQEEKAKERKKIVRIFALERFHHIVFGERKKEKAKER